MVSTDLKLHNDNDGRI